MPNELDLVFIASNRLYIVECKTGKMTEKDFASGSEPVASIIYKADSLGDRVGGIFTISMLCSLEQLPPAHARRAATPGVKIVAGQNIKNLRKIIIEWINE